MLAASHIFVDDWHRPVDKLILVKFADASKHPNWNLGKKITVYSTPLFNKGLDVIKAHYLYGSDYDVIEIVIHPQSVTHSLIETQAYAGGRAVGTFAGVSAANEKAFEMLLDVNTLRNSGCTPQFRPIISERTPPVKSRS
ncbi:hypothetical protein AgCh_034104 [Apium graveolens]